MMSGNGSAAAAVTDCLIIHSILGEASFIGNVTNSTLPGNASFLSASPSASAFDWLSIRVTFFVNSVFCVFGLLGNLMTIIILCRRRMKTAMSCRIERASRAGLIGLAAYRAALIGLAVADLLCCSAALAVTYGRGMNLGSHSVVYSDRELVSVVATVYGPFLQNACVKSTG